MIQRQAFDLACRTTPATQGPTTQGPTTQGPTTQGPTTDDTASDACIDALARLGNGPASCTQFSPGDDLSDEDRAAVCSGECRGLYADLAASCSDVSCCLKSLVHLRTYPVIIRSYASICLVCTKFCYYIITHRYTWLAMYVITIELLHVIIHIKFILYSCHAYI